MLPAWFQAWLRPFCALKPFCRTMPSVMPATAGPIAAPAIAVAIWLAVTTTPDCDQRIRKDASTVQMPVTITTSRFFSVWSMKAPAGAVISMPATPPAVITEPIAPGSQPRCCRKTPRKGPMPACMSAMKKLSALSARMARVLSGPSNEPVGGRASSRSGARADMAPLSHAPCQRVGHFKSTS